MTAQVVVKPEWWMVLIGYYDSRPQLCRSWNPKVTSWENDFAR